MRRLPRWQRWVMLVLAAWAAPAWAQDAEVDPASQQPVAKVVRGTVVDESGRPVAGITVASHWVRREDQPVRASGPMAKTDDQGRFQVEMTFRFGRSQTLYALDLEKSRGGLAPVGPKTADRAIAIKAGPLVRVHGKYVCKELGTPVGWTNSVFSMPQAVQLSQDMTEKGEFSVLLPPGKYNFMGYGGADFGRHRRELTLTADKPDVDLGEIDMVASEIAKLKGKPAPTLHPTDARGVSPSVQIADYKGKWVVLEFWGHWCGPCIAGAIPRLMEIHDDHQGERDKYVVLTVHSALGGESLAKIDEKLVPIVRDTWAGRTLPFPILLDSAGTIQKTFGVTHWPTTLLFDPEGRLVGEINPDALEKKLEPVPPAVYLPRQLDRNTNIYFDNPTLKDAFTLLRNQARAEFDLDPDAIASLPQGEMTRLPLTIGGQISLRSALELLLEPVDLGFKVGPKGYVITRKPPAGPTAATQPSAFQAKCAARIERKLKESKQTYQFDKAPLAKVAAFFEEHSGENVVLDPKGRMQGKIDPATPVTGSGKDEPMGEALAKLVGPLGLRVVVRDEVIVLQAGPASSVAAAAR